MDDLFVHGNAQVTGELAVAQKGALGAVMGNAGCGKVIDLLGSHPGLDKSGYLLEHRAGYRAGGPHGFQVAFALDDDHGAWAEWWSEGVEE